MLKEREREILKAVFPEIGRKLFKRLLKENEERIELLIFRPMSFLTVKLKPCFCHQLARVGGSEQGPSQQHWFFFMGALWQASLDFSASSYCITRNTVDRITKFCPNIMRYICFLNQQKYYGNAKNFFFNTTNCSHFQAKNTFIISLI